MAMVNEVQAWIPVKWGSQRLLLKNFQTLYTIGNWNVPLWFETYRIINNARQRKLVSKIYFSLAMDKPNSVQQLNEFKEQLKKYSVEYDGIFIENKDYKQGKTLGQTIANAMKFMNEKKKIKMNYLLVPQCDVVPKFYADIDALVAYVMNHSVDYLVSGEMDGLQTGAWRLIKYPLNQEVLGQTIAVYSFDRHWIDIHYKADLEEASKWYKQEIERYGTAGFERFI